VAEVKKEIRGQPAPRPVRRSLGKDGSLGEAGRSEISNLKSEIENQKYSGPLWVTLINNAPGTWSGRIVVKEASGAVECRDIWNEKPVAFEYDAQGRVVLKPQIAPWEFKVIEIRRSP